MGKPSKRRPIIEGLEDRLVPTNFGVPWPDARHLTLSFAPDDVRVGSLRSDLFGLLDSSFGDRSWQREILRAAQTWAAQANLNIGLVSDDGRDIGFRGPYQGAEGTGDIRVSAVPMSSEVVAIGSPFDLLAGTWSGDVRLNSAYRLGRGPADGQADLFSVALHELGHSLGLAHNEQDPDSVMREGVWLRTGLSASDLAGLRALYGARQPDPFDEASPLGNESFATATNLVLANQTSLALEGDLTTLSDVDTYEFRPGANLASATFRLRTAGVSLLEPRLTVYDQTHQVVSSLTAADVSGDDLTVTLSGLRMGERYFIRVEGAVDDVFAIGSYRLLVETVPERTPGGGNPHTAAPAGTLQNDDGHTNDTFGTATRLTQRIFQIDPRWDYVYQASLGDAADVDYYRVLAPGSLSDGTAPMTVALWGTSPGLGVRAQVFDLLGRPVEADVIVNDGGNFTLQVPGTRAGMTYFLRVQGASGNTVASGNYTVAVDFGMQAVTLPTVTTGALDAEHPQGHATLSVPESQVVHLLLGATFSGSPSPFSLQVQDGTGTVETIRLGQGDSAASATVFLAPGKYALEFLSEAGQPFAPFFYRLRATSLSDPIGPQLADTTQAPAGSGPSPASGQGGPTPSAPLPLVVTVQEAYSDPVQPVQSAQVANSGPAPAAAGLVTGSPAVVSVGSGPGQDATVPQSSAGGKLPTPATPSVTAGSAPLPASPAEIVQAPQPRAGVVSPTSVPQGLPREFQPVSAAQSPRVDSSIFVNAAPRPESGPGALTTLDRVPPAVASDGAAQSPNRAAGSSADASRALQGTAPTEANAGERRGDPVPGARANPAVPVPPTALRQSISSGTQPPPAETRPAAESPGQPATDAPPALPGSESSSPGEAESTQQSLLWRTLLALFCAPLGLWATQPGNGVVAKRSLKREPSR